jgi:assimilatory nitrate reductase catalytic subunit
MVSAPNALHVEERLKALDFLAVADFFLSETAQLADVVFPAAQWAEEEGTMTNLEGRVIRRRRAFLPPPGVRTDLDLLTDLARRLGKGRLFSFPDPESVFHELRQASAGGTADYSGITYQKIEENNGVFWPCPAEDHPGTPRLFADSFPTPNGKARFHPVQHQPPAEEPDADYPLYLTTGRVLAHYQSGAQTRRVSRLQAMVPEPLVEMHPATATRYGLEDRDAVTPASRSG